jgi:hypothetical protein
MRKKFPTLVCRLSMSLTTKTPEQAYKLPRGRAVDRGRVAEAAQETAEAEAPRAAQAAQAAEGRMVVRGRPKRRQSFARSGALRERTRLGWDNRAVFATEGGRNARKEISADRSGAAFSRRIWHLCPDRTCTSTGGVCASPYAAATTRLKSVQSLYGASTELHTPTAFSAKHNTFNTKHCSKW